MYFKPSYLPHNGAANILVRSLAEELGLSLNKKYKIILASFLAVAKKVNGKAFDWQTGYENLTIWSLFPNVSNKSINEVYKLLKQLDYIGASADIPNYLVERMGFGKPNWIKAKKLPQHFLKEATFIESNLPHVLVNKPEMYHDKIAIGEQSRTAPKFGIQQVKQKFGRDYTLAYRPVKEMNTYWAEHPLYNPIDDEYYSSATRIFHNGSIKSGGCWYGGWTNMCSDQRHSLTIDGHPVVYVDVNGMILSILSCLTGKPMNMIGVWDDVYQRVVCQIPNITNARNMVKDVIMELTGTGNPYKDQPSPDSKTLHDVEQFKHIRDLCLEVYPALKCLDKKRLNFSNELSYHEANILTETLLRLKDMGIIAYPLHDCVLVRLGNELDALETVKSVFKEYVSNFREHKLDLDIAVTVKYSPSNKVKVPGSF